MRIDISDTFRASRATFVEMFFDEAYNVALHDHLDFRSRAVVEREETDETLFLRIDFVSGERLPWVARKLWGDYVGWVEELTYFKGDFRIESRMVPKILGRYVDSRSTLWFTEAGPDTCRREVEINVKVSVPGFGRAIARKIALSVKEGFDKTARFTDRYLVEHAPS